MPVNKNALLRYRILDRCFSDRHHYYDIEELVDKVNEAFIDMYGKTVSHRQIRADISYMKDRVSYDAPIEAIPYDGNKCYYRYSDPNFSIFNSDLSNEEVMKLRSTIEMLGRFPYVINKPIHHSQIVLDEKEHTIQLAVRPNKELEARIFSYGNQVEVLEPSWLREQIFEKFKQIVEIYSTV